MAEAKMGLNITSCKDCEKNSVGAILVDYFKMKPYQGGTLYRYDAARRILQIDEKLLLNAIMLTNPYQEPVKLELVKLQPDGTYTVTARRVDE